MSIPTGRQFAKALEEAGVISDLNSITRVVIDIQPGDAVRVYVERIGGKRLLDAFKGPLGMMLAENAPEPEHEANCNLRYAHQAPRECLNAGPAYKGPVTLWASSGSSRRPRGLTRATAPTASTCRTT